MEEKVKVKMEMKSMHCIEIKSGSCLNVMRPHICVQVQVKVKTKIGKMKKEVKLRSKSKIK